MKKRILVFVVIYLIAIGLGVLTGCQATLSEADDTVITLERTACFGSCPVYTLTVYGDGKVVYKGEDFVKTKRTVNTRISPEEVEILVTEFEKAGYFDLKDNYTERTITDAQTVITSITIDGKTKTIEHYHGDLSTPERLSELENAIDTIVNTDRWIK